MIDERTVTCRMKVRNSDGDGEVICERICFGVRDTAKPEIAI